MFPGLFRLRCNQFCCLLLSVTQAFSLLCHFKVCMTHERTYLSQTPSALMDLPGRMRPDLTDPPFIERPIRRHHDEFKMPDRSTRTSLRLARGAFLLVRIISLMSTTKET